MSQDATGQLLDRVLGRQVVTTEEMMFQLGLLKKADPGAAQALNKPKPVVPGTPPKPVVPGTPPKPATSGGTPPKSQAPNFSPYYKMFGTHPVHQKRYQDAGGGVKHWMQSRSGQRTSHGQKLPKNYQGGSIPAGSIQPQHMQRLKDMLNKRHPRKGGGLHAGLGRDFYYAATTGREDLVAGAYKDDYREWLSGLTGGKAGKLTPEQQKEETAAHNARFGRDPQGNPLPAKGSGGGGASGGWGATATVSGGGSPSGASAARPSVPKVPSAWEVLTTPSTYTNLSNYNPASAARSAWQGTKRTADQAVDSTLAYADKKLDPYRKKWVDKSIDEGKTALDAEKKKFYKEMETKTKEWGASAAEAGKQKIMSGFSSKGGMMGMLLQPKVLFPLLAAILGGGALFGLGNRMTSGGGGGGRYRGGTYG